MWLKLFTTVMLLATLCLLLTRPIIIGPMPHRPATRHAVLVYSERALAFTGAIILTITGAGVGAIVLVRRANAEFRRLALENIENLIEGTVKDHQQKAEPKNESVD